MAQGWAAPSRAEAGIADGVVGNSVRSAVSQTGGPGQFAAGGGPMMLDVM